MKTLDIAVLDGVPEKKVEMVEKYLLPAYALNHTKFVIPPNIQGQINVIHQVLCVLLERTTEGEKELVVLAGNFLESLEQDLKNYRIEAQELNL